MLSGSTRGIDCPKRGEEEASDPAVRIPLQQEPEIKADNRDTLPLTHALCSLADPGEPGAESKDEERRVL